MAITPTTAQVMVTAVRQRTNMELNQFVTDPELIGYLNDSFSILDGLLIKEYNNYKLTKVLLSVNAGTNIISLPNDFLKFQGLDVYFNPGQTDGYYTMFEYDWESRNEKVWPTGGLTGGIVSPYVYQYRLEGNQLTILPPQTASQYQYRLNYTPEYIPLVNLTDTLQTYMDSPNWRSYAIYDTCAQVIAKQDMDPSFFLSQAERLRAHIIQVSAPNRNSGEPKSVSLGSRGIEGSGGGLYGWGW